MISISFYLADIKVLDVSTKMDYMLPKSVIDSPHFIERKKLYQNVLLEVGWSLDENWK